MKKIPAQNYADALIATLEDQRIEKDRAIANFVAAIRRHNDWSRRSQILEAFERAWLRKHGKSLVSIESARPLTNEQKEWFERAWKGAEIRYAENPALVGGVRIVLDGERQFDGSLARKLRTLFEVR